MKKSICACCLLLLISFLLPAQEVFDLTEVEKPDGIAVDHDFVYISEGPSVSVFSGEKLKRVMEFGREGEGPGEFKRFARVFPQTDQLVVFSLGKLSYFTRQGEFIREIRLVGRSVFVEPLADGFVCDEMSRDPKDSMVMKELKVHVTGKNSTTVIGRFPYYMQPGRKTNLLLETQNSFHVDGNSIVVDNELRELLVFDGSGRKISTIVPDFGAPVAVTAEDIRRIDDYYGADPRFGEYYRQSRQQIEFSDHFPFIKEFRVNGGKAYILTYAVKDGKSEILVYNLSGKFVVRTWIKTADVLPNVTQPFAVFDDTVYQLADDEERDVWTLMVNRIF